MRMKSLSVIGLVIALMISITPAWGVDYSTYTNEKLASMRGTMQNATDDERTAFRGEWQERMQAMTPEERQKYSGRPASAPADGSGFGQGRGMGGSGRGGGGGRK